MKIGIDLDDTICRTTEMVNKYSEEFAKEKNIEPVEVFNNDETKEEFFDKYLETIYKNVEIKHDVSSVIKRLKSKGNEIYIITARSNDLVPSINNAYELTKEWLDRNNVLYDDIIINKFRDEKGIYCKDNNIDIMIDNDPYNYKIITSYGTKCLLFDDREKYELNDDYFTSWLEIEKYIEKNR